MTSKPSSISKRAFLGLTGAGTLTSVLPTWRRAEAATNAYDLIVIGGGTAGMPAAIFAADRGARVLVIEKSPVIGGTMDRSSGQMAASRTVWQKAKGIEDSPDMHFEDNMRINRWTADPAITRLFVDNAPDTLNWLASAGFTPIDGNPSVGKGHEHFLTPRYQWGKDNARTILATMKPLFDKAVESGKVTVMLNTGAVDLVQDKTGAVVGVTAEGEGGKAQDFMGRNIVLAAGGCSTNPRMYQDLHGVALTAAIGYPFSQGQGIMLGQGAGGYIRAGDKYLGSFGGLVSDDNYPGTHEASFTHAPDARAPWEIYVNSRGERFMREDHPSVDYREHALLRQPGQRMWVVADHEMIEKAPQWFAKIDQAKFMSNFGEHPMFVKADTVRGLAVKAGINPGGLSDSVESYNRMLAEGATDTFGRVHRPVGLKKGPFYAVRLTNVQLVSFAGLAIDDKLRVVRPDGSAIPNLYAAGEIIGAGVTSGNSYVNGSLITPALTFGRLLGQRMLKFNA